MEICNPKPIVSSCAGTSGIWHVRNDPNMQQICDHLFFFFFFIFGGFLPPDSLFTGNALHPALSKGLNVSFVFLCLTLTQHIIFFFIQRMCIRDCFFFLPGTSGTQQLLLRFLGKLGPPEFGLYFVTETLIKGANHLEIF